jgi:hypothetical protein
MDRPAPDAPKLLAAWMEWERGEVTPGRVMANLKTGGLRELLEGLAAGTAEKGVGTTAEGEQASSWTPIT